MTISRLLPLLRKHGVTSYADADGLRLTFGAPQDCPVRRDGPLPEPEDADDTADEEKPLPKDAVALALSFGDR